MIRMDQKYYHFVILKEKIESGINSCQKYLNELSFSDDEALTSKYQNFGIFEQVWYSSLNNYSKAFNLDFSIKGDGRSPYIFSFLHSKVCYLKTNFLVLVFPYSELAYDIIEKLKEDIHVIRYVNFLYVDIPKIIDLNFEDRLGTKYLNLCKISSIDVTLKNELNLTSIKLNGSNPIKSETYRKLFNSQQENKELTKNGIDNVSFKSDQKPLLENKRIVLACEIFENSGNGYGAKIHIDNYGNYKFYLHVNGVNLSVLNKFITELLEFDCFKETPINPLSRALNTETNDE